MTTDAHGDSATRMTAREPGGAATPAMVTERFTLHCGRFLAGPIRQRLKASAVTYGVSLRIEEDYTWLTTLLIMTVTGTSKDVAEWRALLEDWHEDWQQRREKRRQTR